MKNNVEFNSHTVVRSSGESIEAEIHGESVILQLTTGVYFGVNEVGSRIWQLIKAPHRISALVQELKTEFNVEQDELESDVTKFIQQLLTADLAEICDEALCDSAGS